MTQLFYSWLSTGRALSQHTTAMFSAALFVVRSTEIQPRQTLADE